MKRSVQKQLGLVFLSMSLSSGCVATQDWVKTYVPEQLFPVNKRVSDTEANVSQLGGKMSNVEGQVQTMSKQIADLDSRLKQTTGKADQALDSLQRLKLDRKLVLDLKQGAFFASNSTVLTDQSKKDIDSFLSDVSGDAGGHNRSYVCRGRLYRQYRERKIQLRIGLAQGCECGQLSYHG